MPRKTAPQPQPVPAGPDIALHMLMNDSAPVLLDWVLHHRHAGFRSITVHGDGANAQATALAQALAAAGLIDFVPTTRPGIAHDKARQIRALDLALETALRDRHDHLLWLEPDDFVMIDTGAGTLADLAQGLGRFPDLLSLTVQVAGGSGQNRYADLPLVERFSPRHRRGGRADDGGHAPAHDLSAAAGPRAEARAPHAETQVRPRQGARDLVERRGRGRGRPLSAKGLDDDARPAGAGPGACHRLHGPGPRDVPAAPHRGGQNAALRHARPPADDHPAVSAPELHDGRYRS
nr:glycosyltransferase family 2 protein [Paracoccus sp. NBH48]